MDRDLLEEIAVLGPATKILMMVRHPVDRAWSHAKKDLVRNRGRRAADVADAEWTAFFRDPYQLRCARYADNLANWRACFGNDQVFFGTFEEVEREPARLLQRVTEFLGVRPDPGLVDPALLRAVVNPTGKSEVPEKFRLVLEDLLKDEIEDWRRLVGATGAA